MVSSSHKNASADLSAGFFQEAIPKPVFCFGTPAERHGYNKFPQKTKCCSRGALSPRGFRMASIHLSTSTPSWFQTFQPERYAPLKIR